MVKYEDMSMEEIREMNPVDFVNVGRTSVKITKIFKHYLEYMDFPVTIGEIEYLYYHEKIKTK